MSQDFDGFEFSSHAALAAHPGQMLCGTPTSCFSFAPLVSRQRNDPASLAPATRMLPRRTEKHEVTRRCEDVGTKTEIIHSS